MQSSVWAVTRYARRLGGRASFAAGLLRADGLIKIDLTGELQALLEGRRLLFVFWSADAMAFMLLPFVQSSLRRFLPELQFLFDDTIGGRLSAEFLRSLGGQSTILGLPGSPLRLERLRCVVADRRSCVFAVDGGGPYRRIGTGVVTLATTVGARIVPIAIRARPSIAITPFSHVAVPLPGCRVGAAFGPPIAVSRASDRRTVAEEVRQTLESLRRAAYHLAGTSQG